VVAAKKARLAGDALARRGAREVRVTRPGQAAGDVWVHGRSSSFATVQSSV
jgi:hypothetical protein